MKNGRFGGLRFIFANELNYCIDNARGIWCVLIIAIYFYLLLYTVANILQSEINETENVFCFISFLIYLEIPEIKLASFPF